MSKNKLALIRYKILDECLRNKYRKWTLDDLVNEVSDMLYEYEGIENGVAVRTIQQDIMNMRSDKLGYNAPIVVYDRKYYKYEDEDYSITKIPISSNDLDKMNQAVSILKQFKGFNHFSDLSEMITKLESKVHSSKNKVSNHILFEKNDLLKGAEFLDSIHRLTLQKKAILIEYKSFTAINSSQIIVSPYFLKEYRNRWFLLCRNNKNKNILTLALDRMIDVQGLSSDLFLPPDEEINENYYDNLVGVTKTPNQRPINITFKVDNYTYPYIITKPIHHTQKVIENNDDYHVLRIRVIWNYEIERVLLGFGETLTVITPRKLRNKLLYVHRQAFENYTSTNEEMKNDSNPFFKKKKVKDDENK
jgi:predicted DNA-binding transcriptional regulator YafY